jgi:hypothetical protein
MTESNQSIQEAANSAIDMLATPKSPRPLLSPQQWEELARYVESKYIQSMKRAIQGEKLIEEGLVGTALDGQVIFWRASVAVARKIAWDFRVGWNGPLNALTYAKKGADVTPPK